MSQVPCTGPECLLCKLLGEPTSVQVPVKDLNDDGKVKLMTMKKNKALELGLIKDEAND